MIKSETIKIDDVEFRMEPNDKDFNKSIALNINDFTDLYFYENIDIEDIKFLLKKKLKHIIKIKIKDRKMLKITHIKKNIFKIIHNKKEIEVTILNLFKEFDYYANILDELRNDNFTKDNHFSLLCDFDIYINKDIRFKDKHSLWCDVSEYYKEKLIFHIIDNKEYFINLYNETGA